MDDKQFLLDTIKSSELPEDVKNDLIQRIASEGATKEIAMEVADLLDLQADVFEMSANVKNEQAKAYEDLANGLEAADKEEDAAINKVVDEADKELTEIETEMKSNEPVSTPAPVDQPQPQVVNPVGTVPPEETPQQ